MGRTSHAMRPASCPGRQRTTASLLLLAILSAAQLSACEANGDSDTATRPEHGHATGRVVDTRGRPIAGARVYLDNTVFHASHMQATTGEDGSYRLKLYPGAWLATAKFRTDYNGRTYELELHPENGDSFDDGGAVRDFTWKLEGRSPLSEYRYYGGFILVFTANGFYEDMDAVELTLTPDGPLIDGSEGDTLRLRFGDRHWVQYGHVEDIPIGRYQVTATLDTEAGPRPLRIQDYHTHGEFQSRFQLDFLPESTVSPKENSAAIAIGW